MPGPLDYLLPPPMPGLLQSGTDGQPFYPSAPNWGEQRDPFAFGAARPPPAGDVVLPTARPGFADTMPRIPRSIHRNDARLFGGDFIPAAWQGSPGGGLPDDRRALDLNYTPPITPDDRYDMSPRYPLAGDVESATPPQAWFENPSWLRGEPPPGWAQPYPSPSGLSGSYTGHGKLLGKQSPLRGTYRHTWEF